MKLTTAALLASSLLGAGAEPTAKSPSANEQLLNLLERKGILSESEARELLAEQARAPKPAAAPAWVSSMRIGGDLRGRFEGLYAENPAFTDRTRFRFRLRAGLVSSLWESFEVGLRLASGEPANFGGSGGDPISTNASLQDNGSKKLLYIDLAYAKWIQSRGEFESASTFGKMENPFIFSDLVFDHDYTPEGLAHRLAWKLSDCHTLGLNVAGFALDGPGVMHEDAYLLGAQARWDANLSDHWKVASGIAQLAIVGEDALSNPAVPNQNRGNSRPGANSFGPGALAGEFHPIVADAGITWTLDSFPLYPGKFPIALGGDFMRNTAVSSQGQGWSAGIAFGKSGRKGQWDFSYRWKSLEADAWYEEFVDSDFGAFYQAPADAGGSASYGAGTNVRGHVLKAGFSPVDSFTLGATAYVTELINESPAGSESSFLRLQLDAIWKF